MPTLDASLWKPTSTYPVFAATSEVPRVKPKTPLIAGSVCGGVMGIAWIIGFSIYFRKRYMRKKLNRQVAAGKAVPKKKPPKVPEQKIIVPPDPAILLGHRLPGENAFRDGKDADAEPTHVTKDDLQQHDEKKHLQTVEETSEVPATPAAPARISDEMVIPR